MKLETNSYPRRSTTLFHNMYQMTALMTEVGNMGEKSGTREFRIHLTRKN